MKIQLVLILLISALVTIAADKTVSLSATQVDSLIKKEGSTKPEWLDKVKLKYPKTLDLTFTKKSKKWEPNKITGTYFWAKIRLKPQFYKEGIKLLYHLIEVNKGRPASLEQCYQHMAFIYAHMKDWPRAAYFAQKQKRKDYLLLAECYFKMGCKPMALKLLSKYRSDSSRQGTIIKLLADIGEYNRAEKLAIQKAKRTPDIAYLMAGYAFRNAGDLEKAATYYKKASEAKRGGRDIKRNKTRGKQSFQATEKLKNYDLSKISDGKYKGSANGYRGYMEVEVEVKKGKIVKIKIIKTRDDRPLNAYEEVPEAIIEKQGITGVDAITSATISSEALMNAVANALVK